MYQQFYKLLLVVSISLVALLGRGGEVEDVLGQFEKVPSAAVANRYFTLLQQQGITDEPVTVAANAPVDTLRQQVWYWAAEYYYAQQQYDRVMEYGLKALPLCHAGNNRYIEADCLNLLAVNCIRKGDNDQAAHYALQCYKLDEASGDIDRISSSLNTLTAIYLGANQPKEAEQYVLRGLELARKSGNEARLAVLNGMASEVYHAQGKDQQALEYAQTAYDIERRLGREDKAMVRLAEKASALIGLHRYADAEQVLRQVVPFFEKVGDKQSLGISCNKLGMTLLSQHREAEAVPYYRKAAEIFLQLGDPYNEVHARRGLYESLWKSDPDAAKLELDRFNDLKDSIYNNTSAESLARYNAEFGNDWLLLENHAEREAKQRAIVAGIAVAALLLLLTGVIWWVMRRRHLQQQAINLSLTASIEELRAKYDQLQVHYDNAMSTGGESAGTEALTDADKAFLEQAVTVTNRLIHTGQVSVENIAAELGMSVFQLRQRLDEVLGEKPATFIQNIRMRRARHLLDHQRELNISEVAALCGYNDTPNFTRAFKKAFGITPTQYQSRG
ncbi:MAG: helix-turn-helix domain-containing protein [Muribaculaceae bacterium]|nr:helix-turn-helix domain-containing protein [Muribaculaceae bacterium]